jgi:hypothetical protein
VAPELIERLYHTPRFNFRIAMNACFRKPAVRKKTKRAKNPFVQFRASLPKGTSITEWAQKWDELSETEKAVWKEKSMLEQ